MESQVLDQTAELNEDNGIYDALGCQARHEATELWILRCHSDPEMLCSSGRGEAGHSLHALFRMVCPGISDPHMARHGRAWYGTVVVVFVGNLGMRLQAC